MPKYRIKLSDGRTVMVESDAPPSEADVLGALSAHAATPPPEAPAGPSMLDRAASALPTAGGMVGGMLGGIPGAALGGAAGTGLRELAQNAGQIPGAISDVASGLWNNPGATMGGFLRGAFGGAKDAAGEAALQGGAQGAGVLAGGALKTLGRGLYRAGALPLNQITKYGDLVGKGLEHRVPVTKAGLAKAGVLKTAAQATKQKALSAADDLASIRPGQIAQEATDELLSGAAKTARTGKAVQSTKILDRAARFTQQNQPGLRPSAADEIKGTLDDTLGGAFQKMRQRMPLSASESGDMAYRNAIDRALTDTVPKFKELNKGVMDASGLQKMIGRRVNPGSGGNQGLENAMLIAGGPAALPARLLMLPGVASSMGIAANEAGKAAPAVASNLLRAAILAQLEDE